MQWQKIIEFKEPKFLDFNLPHLASVNNWHLLEYNLLLTQCPTKRHHKKANNTTQQKAARESVKDNWPESRESLQNAETKLFNSASLM